ncbi:C-glycoside deglycosidase beta subunit domain-containing protein [Phytohabitans rumicis]|uniref:C-glycoside deglycosidase beta subunit domain-containing protein n=1 Tax=Phytohabitans rumicis TaxID=1076125 RepID=UPI00156534EA|nr:DUF6379 domain-containing protein [Phytohabitans rumicis]
MPGGFTAALRLTWYRALPLSCIERITVTIDGQQVEQDAVRFSLGPVGPLPVAALAPLTDTWWYVLDSALLSVESAAAGEPGVHEISVVMGLHIPYLPVGGKPLVNLDTCAKQLEVAA